MIGKIKVTSSGYEPDTRVDDPTLGTGPFTFYVIRFASGMYLAWTRTVQDLEVIVPQDAFKFTSDGAARKYAIDRRLAGFSIETWERPCFLR